MAIIDSFIEQPQYDGSRVKVATRYDTVTGIHVPRLKIANPEDIPGGGGSFATQDVAVVADVLDLTDPDVNVWFTTSTLDTGDTVELPDPETTGHEIVVLFANGWPWTGDPGGSWQDANDSSVSWASLPPVSAADVVVSVRLVPVEVGGFYGWVAYAEAPYSTKGVFDDEGNSLDDLLADVGSGDVVGPASSVDGEVALFDSTTGKLIKRATTTGILKATSGVLSGATQGTDYYAPGGTDVAVADGGTGASTASGARTNLGAVGSDGTVLNVVALTQTAYNALTPVSTTLYVITGP